MNLRKQDLVFLRAIDHYLRAIAAVTRPIHTRVAQETPISKDSVEQLIAVANQILDYEFMPYHAFMRGYAALDEALENLNQIDVSELRTRLLRSTNGNGNHLAGATLGQDDEESDEYPDEECLYDPTLPENSLCAITCSLGYKLSDSEGSIRSLLRDMRDSKRATRTQRRTLQDYIDSVSYGVGLALGYADEIVLIEGRPSSIHLADATKCILRTLDIRQKSPIYGLVDLLS